MTFTQDDHDHEHFHGIVHDNLTIFGNNKVSWETNTYGIAIEQIPLRFGRGEDRTKSRAIDQHAMVFYPGSGRTDA